MIFQSVDPCIQERQVCYLYISLISTHLGRRNINGGALGRHYLSLSLYTDKGPEVGVVYTGSHIKSGKCCIF